MSATCTVTSPSSIAALTETRPPGGVKRTAFARRFTTICWTRSASAVTGGKIAGYRDVEPQLAALGERAHLVEGLDDRAAEVGRTEVELEPSRAEPSELHDLADEREEPPAARLDGLRQAHLLGRERSQGPGMEEVRGPADRGEGGAEIVGDSGEELVLEPVDLSEPGRHPVEGAREVADLAGPGDLERLRELARGHGLGGRAELVQRPGDAQDREGPEAEADQARRDQRREAEDARPLRHRLERGLAPPELGPGGLVEAIEDVLELHRRMNVPGRELAPLQELTILVEAGPGLPQEVAARLAS